ncbi:pentatricopeptide repeat-containing protein At2g13600-like [Ricinus communis]|uniref:pentatricopeptide repeat-containing protein At2g13600-like n=1 Tax=Ricinus communis TaxID=3988 RepID=UPI00201A6441|nr:pentatricopeptide repeat-containing protein At2g13600-like [Ricinus communis]XP_048225519.1 pentatricopeptide repeat-containing protein At2g13600-like [Ricinus communis]
MIAMAKIPAQLFESISPPPSLLSTEPNSPHNFPNYVPFQRPKQSPQPLDSVSHLTNNYHLSSLYTKPINSTGYASVLDSCNSQNLGTQVHAHAIKTGFHCHDFVQTKLLQMYAKFGCLECAHLLFDSVPLRNLHSWLAILNVYFDHGLFDEAFSLFQELLFEDIELEFFAFPLVFKICSGLGMVELGRQLHAMVMKYLFFSNIYVGNALIDMYGKCGSLDDAKKVLTLMPHKDNVSWNSVITACATNGMVYEALEFLEKMRSSDYPMPNLVTWSAVIGGFAQNGYDAEAIELLLIMQAEGIEPNARTLASVLPACARLQKLSLGKIFHGYIMRHGFMSNPFVVNGLIDVYRRCGDMDNAVKIFSRFSLRNEVSYNTMIVGYCAIGDVSKAKEFFDQMEVSGVKRERISWNSMISGYVDNFMFDEALNMFRNLLKEGIEPDSFTLGSVLTACADTASLRQGKEIHSYAIVKSLQSNTFVGGALIEMYSKCQDPMAAQLVFNEVIERDAPTWNVLISCYARCNQNEEIRNLLQKMQEDGFEPNIYTWNGILAGYVENGHLDLAMQLFSEMHTGDVRPDIFTVGIILPACSKLATLERGKQVHAHSIRCYYDSDVHIGAGLVDMYAKCGSLQYAQLAYSRISNHNLVCHNVMLTAYAMHGYGEEGIALFRTIRATGFQPDNVTFLSVLASCVHAGLVEVGNEFFHLMGCYNVKPALKHYTSMVDLLSRSGQLNKAYELIKKMPMEPDSVLWGALLGGCVIHGNVELGKIAAERLIELEPNNTGNYVLLANLYAYARQWSDLARIRHMMKDRGLHKSPGCSWIEDKDEIYAFLACDRSHKRTEEIYNTLNNLAFHMTTWMLAPQ